MPSLQIEDEIRDELGPVNIAGVDEAGRGAIAGPVVAAAVILPVDDLAQISRLTGVDDSKLLPAKRREELFDLIVDVALAFGIANVNSDVIDRTGIISANAQAMKLAISQLDPPPGYLLIDGRMRIRSLPTPQRSIIRGDRKSLSIAAASILAKVSRDRCMISLDEDFPQYGFSRHKGYCTKGHRLALDEHGPCPLHRHSFAPIRISLL